MSQNAISEVPHLKSQAAYLNRAADYIDRADEERIHIQCLSQSVNTIAMTTIIGLSIILAIAIGGSVALSFLGSSAASTVMIHTFQGMGLILGLVVPYVAYHLYQSSKHLHLARSFEEQSLSANARAAEMPVGSDYGLFLKCWSWLFSIGNSVTRYGKDNVGGRRHYSW